MTPEQILDRWQRAMDNPAGPPLEVHHADIATLRAALVDRAALERLAQEWKESAEDPRDFVGLATSVMLRARAHELLAILNGGDANVRQDA